MAAAIAETKTEGTTGGATNGATDVASRVRDLVSYIEAGRIIEAMYEFYADGVSMQENNNAPTVGLAANVERERQFVASVRRWNSLDVRAVAVDPARGKAAVQSALEFETVDGRTVSIDQVAVQTWRDGRIVHEKFYYDTGAPAATDASAAG